MSPVRLSKGPEDPRDRGRCCDWAVGGVLDKRQVVVLCMSLGYSVERERDGAATGTVWLAVHCQMERLPADIRT